MLHLNTHGVAREDDKLYLYAHNCAPNVNLVVNWCNTFGLNGIVVNHGKEILLDLAGYSLLKDPIRVLGYKFSNPIEGTDYSCYTQDLEAPQSDLSWFVCYLRFCQLWIDWVGNFREPHLCFYADERTHQRAGISCIWKINNLILELRIGMSITTTRVYDVNASPYQYIQSARLNKELSFNQEVVDSIYCFLNSGNIHPHIFIEKTNQIIPMYIGYSGAQKIYNDGSYDVLSSDGNMRRIPYTLNRFANVIDHYPGY